MSLLENQNHGYLKFIRAMVSSYRFTKIRNLALKFRNCQGKTVYQYLKNNENYDYDKSLSGINVVCILIIKIDML